jgi:hypothetical protein
LVPYLDLSGGNGGPNFDVGTTYGGVKWWAHIAPNAVVSFAGGGIVSATITLTNRPDGAAEYLSFQDGFEPSAYGLTSGGYFSSTGQLTISGKASPSVYQTMLRSLVYVDSNTNPTVGDRTITVQMSSGGIFVSNRPYSTVTVARDPSLSKKKPGYVPPQPVTANITRQQLTWITNSGFLTRAVITLTNRPDGASEYLAISNPAGLTAKPYNGGTGQLILTGFGDAISYQRALRSVV